jgi:hypothetical protein
MVEIKEEKLQEELQQASISLVLDTYDDIFSDFDPRPYSERALSDDFLLECKRAARDKEQGFELILSIPKKLRSIADENKIRKRLRDHFRKHHTEKEKQVTSIKKEGLIWVGVGTMLMLAATALETYTKSFSINLLTIIMEPASWFSFWEGLAKIFIRSKEAEPEALFYHKMANAIFTFREY